MAKSSRVTKGLLGVAALAALCVGGGVQATADTAEEKGGQAQWAGPVEPVPAGFSSWRELFTVQGRLNAGADRISAAAGPGFGSVVVSLEDRGLRLYWKGEPQAAAQEAIRQVRDGGVPVRVESAAYSKAELAAATMSIATQAQQAQAAQGAAAPSPAAQNRVTAVGPRPDSSGLLVSVAGDDAEAARALPPVRDSAVPVTIRTGQDVQHTAVDRWHDVKPFWAGGPFYNGWWACTAGFTLYPSNKMLTAAHCGDLGDTVKTPSGATIGTFTSRWDYMDAAVISAPAQGKVWTSPFLGLQYHAPVLGQHHNYVGELVCTEGAYSFERCRIQITEVGMVVLADGKLVQLQVKGIQIDHKQAVRSGDSGGPVLDWGYTTTTGVFAKGIISSMVPNPNLTCTGVSSSGGGCGDVFYFTDLYAATIAAGTVVAKEG